MQVRETIAAHPDVKGNVNEALMRFIEEAYSCVQACTSCADACLAEDMVQELIQCIRLDLDCADISAAAASIATRRSGGDVEVLAPVIQACLVACRRCAEECERHASKHEHCRICAEACRRCEAACQEALASLGAAAR